VNRTEVDEFERFIMHDDPHGATKLYVSGRRRIGKSFAVKTAARICHKKGRYVIFVEGSVYREIFIENFVRALNRFISGVPAPKTISHVANCTSWLLDSGVSIVVDEFQYLLNKCQDFMEALKVVPFNN
jgi:AAA+ ATPase superfamily predicted ATPase